MMQGMRPVALFAVLLAAGCAEPGKPVFPMEGDFAFLEMKLGA
jgi:hypothetical protein